MKALFATLTLLLLFPSPFSTVFAGEKKEPVSPISENLPDPTLNHLLKVEMELLNDVELGIKSQDQLEIAANYQNSAKRVQFLLITGVGGEFSKGDVFSGYYVGAREVCGKEFKGNCIKYVPSSNQDPFDNTLDLLKTIYDLHKKINSDPLNKGKLRPKKEWIPIVPIGHSMGGQLIHWLIHLFPELLWDENPILASPIMLQAPIKGTFFAAFDRKDVSIHRRLARTFALGFLQKAYIGLIHEKTLKALKLLEQGLKVRAPTEKEIKELSERVTYIATHAKKEEMSLICKLGSFFSIQGPPSQVPHDGGIYFIHQYPSTKSLKDLTYPYEHYQVPTSFGKVYEIDGADHLSLAIDYVGLKTPDVFGHIGLKSFASGDPLQRRAFWRSLYKLILNKWDKRDLNLPTLRSKL